MSYAEPIARTCFSLLDGASQPHELIAAAAAAGVSRIGICDRDGVYGLVQAATAARDTGVQVVCGATLTVVERPSVSVLVERREGWANLCRLLTLGRRRRAKGWSAVTAEELAAHADGLLIILRPGWEAIDAGRLAEAARDRLFVALSRDLTPADGPRIRAATRLAHEIGRSLLATNDVRMHIAERRIVGDVLACIRRGTTLRAAGRSLAANGERYLLSEAEFRQRYAAWPDAIAASVAATERCSFQLSELRYGYPREVVPEQHTPQSWLRELTERGLAWRYPAGVPQKVRDLVEHELGVVEELDFASYFLTVHDAVWFAKGRGILCQGRGSAANSAVCFALGITAVDPRWAELLFERFISKERGEPPDIDVDFEHERREEVIQYIYERYGRDRAGMVNEFITYRQRSAIREVGKVFGLSLDQVDRLARSVDRWSAGLDVPSPADSGRAGQKWAEPHEGGHASVFAPPIDAVAELVAEAGLDPESPEVRATLQVSGELAGFPRHLSIHVGGFVIAAECLEELVPIEPASMEGRTVLQWDKYDIEALEFVKVDVLALGILTAIRKAFDLVEQTGGPALSLATVPQEDPEVYDMFCRADTVGVFQIESRAQMSMLPRLKPRCYYDLVIEVAIVRPGPIQGGMVHPYLRRRTSKEPITYAHPALEPILQRTMGVPLFQEQVMAIAVAVGGFSAGEADRLRRAMGAWRKRGNLQEMGRRLVAGMVSRGIDREYAEQIYNQILGFGEYGFPESHAASFALLVYVSGWLKCHHPAAFAAALINSQPMGFYSPRALLADAQRHGVEVRPPCVVASAYDCTLESDPETASAIRVGLRLIRGFGEEHAKAICDARAERPFASLADFAHRTGLDRGRLQTLADAGAFAALVGPDRRRAAWLLQGLWTDLPLFAGQAPAEEVEAELPSQGPLDRLRADYRSTGLSVELHPIQFVRPELDTLGAQRMCTLYDLENDARVKVGGMVSTRQRPGTSNGVVFFTLEDETGMVNLVVWPKTWAEHRKLARNQNFLGVDGRVQRQDDALSILVDRFWELPAPPEDADPAGLGTLPVRSRDFH